MVMEYLTAGCRFICDCPVRPNVTARSVRRIRSGCMCANRVRDRWRLLAAVAAFCGLGFAEHLGSLNRRN